MAAYDNLIANPAVVCREEFDDWCLLVDQDANKAFSINPCGAVVWGLLDGKRSFSDLVDGLKMACDNASETINQDIEVFLKNLLDLGFIHQFSKASVGA